MPPVKAAGVRPSRRQHSAEVLEQIVHEHHVLGKRIATIARDLNIPKSTVAGTIKRWEETGQVKKEKLATLDDEAWDAMVELGQDIPLKGIAERLETSFGIKPALSTISGALKKLEYSKLSGAKSDDSRLNSLEVESSISGQSNEPSVSGRSQI